MRVWRKKPFPHYDDLALLVDGIIATGEGAFRPGRSETVTPAPLPTSQKPCEPRPAEVCYINF